jgi:transposase, IS5 family
LILDASCISSDVAYPKDLGLLNKGREMTNEYIDKLYKPVKKQLENKPKTERKKAQKNYLKGAKKKVVTEKERKKAIQQQLKYLVRNLEHIENLIQVGSSLDLLTKTKQRKLESIQKISEQQKWMFENNKRSI